LFCTSPNAISQKGVQIAIVVQDEAPQIENGHEDDLQ
jgi:hypothetical protein